MSYDVYSSSAFDIQTYVRKLNNDTICLFTKTRRQGTTKPDKAISSISVAVKITRSLTYMSIDEVL